VSHHIYAHRAIPSVLVQEIRLSNPTAHDVRFKVRILEYFTLSVKSVKTVAVNLGNTLARANSLTNHKGSQT